MLEISKQLFSDLNNCKILYCHWKSNEHLEEGLNGLTDLDILVSLVNKNSCENILRNLDFMKCKSQYGSRYRNVDDWIGYDTKTGKLIHVHLHYQMITGHRGMKEYSLPWSQEALDTRTQDHYTGVYMIEPNLEIMTLYTRIALKATTKKVNAARKGEFKLDYYTQKEITFLKERIDMNFLRDLAKKYYSDDRLLGNLIEKEVLSSEDFLLLHCYITKKMEPYRTSNRILSFVYQNHYNIALYIRHILRKKANRLIINKKTPQQGGMMIAFIGQDGSGKSTVTDEIQEWLTWKLEAYKFYLGSGEHYQSWQKSLKKRIKSIKKYKIITILSALLTLSNHIAVAKRTCELVSKGKRYAQNGGIAIYDRFPQNIHFGINDGPKIRVNYLDRIGNPVLKKYLLYCAKKEEKYLAKATRVAPQIVFKLILPSEISIIRKPEEDLEIVKRKHEIINSLSFPQSIVYSVDATNEYIEEIKEIKGVIWDNLPKHK